MRVRDDLERARAVVWRSFDSVDGSTPARRDGGWRTLEGMDVGRVCECDTTAREL